MSKVKSLVASALTLAVIGSAAQAAPIINFKATIVRATDTGGNANPVAINSQNYTGGTGVAKDYQIEVDAEVTGLAAGTSFGDSSFDVTITPTNGAVVTHLATAHYNWSANNPAWTDDAGNGPHLDFSTAGDKGVSSSDFVAITNVVDNTVYSENFGSANDPNDPRDLIANGTFFKFGTYDINWNGIGNVTLSFANGQVAPLDDTALTYGTVSTQFTSSNALLSGSAVSGPEPASLGLLALGGMALMARRRKA